MNKRLHEIRDPIHTFVRLDTDERKVVDSPPVQRLRHIHQLALTNLIYPGATHRRFEHSLGVMELAGRVYDTVTDPENIRSDSVRDIVPKQGTFDHQYWRRVVRMAALCHDIGHLPFSHAGEDLLPEGKKHEHLSIALIEGDLMKPLWKELKIEAKHVAQLSVGAGKYTTVRFNDWESILSEVIIGDAFGVDRIDYLLRDSYHTGVAYGKFDHNRLIDTLRILPRSYTEGSELSLGIELGGLHAAEALLLARYFMYTQVYFHPVRRVYDHHLVSYIKAKMGRFSTDLEEHLALTDNELMAALLNSSRTPSDPGYVPARLIVGREHFKQLAFERDSSIQRCGKILADGLSGQFGSTFVHYALYRERSRPIDFPVWTRSGVSSSAVLSDILQRLPIVEFEYVFVSREKHAEAERWLRDNGASLLKAAKEADE